MSRGTRAILTSIRTLSKLVSIRFGKQAHTMSSINISGPGNRVLPARQDQHSQLRLALAALAMPAFFVIGRPGAQDSRM